LQESKGKWTGRFIWASVIEGLFGVIWTLFITNPFVSVSASRVLAEGGAGSWLFTGYSLFLTVGVAAVAVTAMFYHYIESVQGKPYRGVTNYLAWGHIILMNVGVMGATFLMMWAGYAGGVASLPTTVGGGGLNPGQVHEQILHVYPEPIFYFVLIAVLGVLMGGLGYVIAGRRK